MEKVTQLFKSSKEKDNVEKEKDAIEAAPSTPVNQPRVSSPRLLTPDRALAEYDVEFPDEAIGIDLETDFLSGGQHAVVSAVSSSSAAEIDRIKQGGLSQVTSGTCTVILTARFLTTHP